MRLDLRAVYSRTPVPRTFSSSYLAGEPIARAFFPRDFRDGAGRVARAREAAQRTVSPAVAAVLREQQARLPSSRARQENLEALVAGNTAVVVSGQQVGLFLGPLYTFYKAASAIAVARAIQTESGVRCVPLFWLQTEDHDFAEIAGCVVASERDGGPTRLTLAEEAPDEARRSVAHRVLGREVTSLLDDLAEHLGDGPSAREVMAVLRAHYVAGRPLAEAFAGALAELFSDEGLLFLDPRDERLARQAAPLYRRAIDDATLIDRCLGDQAARLAAADFSEQIPLRPGSPLVFVHPDGAEGPRFRLQRREAPEDGATTADGAASSGAASYVLAGTDRTISARDVVARLEHEPLACSTSALLRPLVQDTLLPTVAYVGGPAELSYFAQLLPLYRLFDLTPPLVIPRARFRCLDARARRLLDALALAPDDLSRPEPELLARVAVSRPAGATDPAALERQVNEDIAPRIAALADAIVAVRPELARAAGRTRRSVAHALGRLNARYARALLDRDTVTRDRLTRLQNLLQPDGAPQERTYGWPSLAARVGPAAFKQAVFAALAEHGTFVTHLLDLRP
jgi:bacillithiol biosynthesis cysteine-adding enzyme BshC